MLRSIVSRIMLSSLRAGFRRICWVGPEPEFDEDLPVVAYANHHTFYDGYAMWLLGRELLGRRSMLWMEEWYRYPFFAVTGAYPFPRNNPKLRLRTIRQTASRMASQSTSYLIYFPSGTLQPPEAGLGEVDADVMRRLDRIFPDKYWWPVSIHMTSWGETLPTLLLTGGAPHRLSTGDEAATLQEGLDLLRTDIQPCSRLLL